LPAITTQNAGISERKLTGERNSGRIPPLPRTAAVSKTSRSALARSARRNTLEVPVPFHSERAVGRRKGKETKESERLGPGMAYTLWVPQAPDGTSSFFAVFRFFRLIDCPIQVQRAAAWSAAHSWPQPRSAEVTRLLQPERRNWPQGTQRAQRKTGGSER
jgi:hypothetical protein